MSYIIRLTSSQELNVKLKDLLKEKVKLRSKLNNLDSEIIGIKEELRKRLEEERFQKESFVELEE